MVGWGGAIITAGLLAGGPALAAANCPRPPQLDPVRIEVRTSLPKPQYRNDLGRVELSQMRNGRTSNGRGHATTLGLTVSSFHIGWQVRWLSYGSDQRRCLWPASAVVDVALARLVVHVAKDYRPGSCQFNAITLHENEHVRVNQAVIQRHAPAIQEELARVITRLTPVDSAESDRLKAGVRQAIEAVTARMYAERDRDNGAIDTPHSYRQVARRCSNW